jgi:soluble lytic murein transglycosylase-like protein
MPKTWKHIEKNYDFQIYKYDADINTRVGTKYLIELYDILAANHPRWDILTIEQKQEQISAAYNGGPNRLIKKGFDITQMPEETRNYVEKMKGRYPIIRNNKQVENYLTTNTDIKQIYTIPNLDSINNNINQ